MGPWGGPASKRPAEEVGESLALRYALSCVAASVAETVTYPLDLTKTRLQTQGEVATANLNLPASHASSAPGPSGTAKAPGPLKPLVPATRLGAIAMASSIVRKEGPGGLFRGLTPGIGRHLVYTGVRICAYEQLRKKAGREADGSFPAWKAMGCGVVAGGSAQLLASPADLVKIQLQMEGRRRAEGLPPRVLGLRDAVSRIVREGGVAGLWKGWPPSVQRAALVNMADLATYDKTKHWLLRESGLGDTWVLHGLSSVCSGFAAAVCSTPMDVVKTRVMNQPTDSQGRGLAYKGTIDCFAKTVSQEGFFALYKGFVPIWTRMGPWSLTFWLSYEKIRKLCGSSTF